MKKIAKIVCETVVFAAIMVTLCGCAHYTPQAVSKQFVNAIDKKDAALLAECMYWDDSVQSVSERQQFVQSLEKRFAEENYTQMRFVSYHRGNQLTEEELQQIEQHYNCRIKEAAHIDIKIMKADVEGRQQEDLQLIAFRVNNLWYATTDFTVSE